MATILIRQNFHLMLALATLTVTAPSPAVGAPIACSEAALRSAINGASTGDTITLPANCIITLTGAADEDLNGSGDLDINENTIATALAIEGAGTGTTIIDGGGVDRLLHIRGGRTVTVRDLTLRNGDVTPSASQGGAIAFGPGTLTLERVIVSSSRATLGGGIYHLSGALTLTDVAIVGNTAVTQGGGGLAVAGTATLTNVTVSGNIAAQGGGGIIVVGSLTLDNVTITDNTSSLGVGGLYAPLGTSDVTNAIMAGNIGGSGPDCSGTLNNVANVIVQTPGCTVTGTGTLTTADPLLLALANNGGATLTHALLPTSPAINTANAGACPATDQRGHPRAGICDIGAFEFAGTPFTMRGDDVGYGPGQRLSLGVLVATGATGVSGDVYIGIILPAGAFGSGCSGLGVVFLDSTGELQVVCTSTASLSSFAKAASNITIPANTTIDVSDLIVVPALPSPLPTGVWQGFILVTAPNAFADNRIDAGDIGDFSAVNFFVRSVR